MFVGIVVLQGQASFFHIRWTFKFVVPYWTMVITGVTQMIGFSPRIFLLHNLTTQNIEQMFLSNKTLVGNLLVAATILLAKYWKQVNLPTKDEWCQKIHYMFLMHKLTAITNFRRSNYKVIDTFNLNWKKFLLHWS